MADKIDHDGIFKSVLQKFFPEFCELFVPDLYERMEGTDFSFLNKELLFQITGVGKMEADLVAEFREEGRRSFLVHLEIQSQTRSEFQLRLFRYFCKIYAAFDAPVFPIVLFTFASPRTQQRADYVLRFAEHDIARLEAVSIQLDKLRWQDFLRSDNPVAAAFMAKMKMAPEDKPRVKLECMLMSVRLNLDAARKNTLIGFVDTYLRLNSEVEKERFSQLLAEQSPTEKEEVMEIVTSWQEEGNVKGLQKAICLVYGEAISDSEMDRIKSLSTEKLELLLKLNQKLKAPGKLKKWLDEQCD